MTSAPLPAPVQRVPHVSEQSLTRFSATELAALICRGEVSAVEVVRHHERRHQETHAGINALVLPTFAQAYQEAEEADRRRARGESLPPLHGVPFTVKDCFHVRGLPSTLGLPNRINQPQGADGPLVRRLRAAGGILIGKTNVPQLMMVHETMNPLFGRTRHPLDFTRTPGGSSGGEAAAVAAHVSPLGLGNDLGGSVRIPAAWCGLYGLKPTAFRLTNRGIAGNFHGMHAMNPQSGPFTRTLADLELVWQVLQGDGDDIDIAPTAKSVSGRLPPEQIHVWAWDDDGYFPACPAAKRAVREAAARLEERGVRVEWVEPKLHDLIDLYYGIMGADGAADARRLAKGNKLDPTIARMLWMAGVKGVLRQLIITGFMWQGQRWLPHVLRRARPQSASEYWQSCHWLASLRVQFVERYFPRDRITAIVCPPHALPALPHNAALDLLPAASYAYLANLLGLPAGVVPWSCTHPTEDSPYSVRDRQVDTVLRHTLTGSAGLPSGVQIIANSWREDVILTIMKLLADL